MQAAEPTERLAFTLDSRYRLLQYQETGVDKMSEDNREVHNTAFWGAFMLD
jgi:hypothetical protein